MDEFSSSLLEQYGWERLTAVGNVADDGYFIGFGDTLPDGTGIYLAQVVPEPNTIALLAAGLALATLLTRRRQA